MAHVVERTKGLLWGKKVGESCMVVIDGQERSQYERVVAPPGQAGIIFDSRDELHYIARKDNPFYLVEERLA